MHPEHNNAPIGVLFIFQYSVTHFTPRAVCSHQRAQRTGVINPVLVHTPSKGWSKLHYGFTERFVVTIVMVVIMFTVYIR